MKKKKNQWALVALENKIQLKNSKITQILLNHNKMLHYLNIKAISIKYRNF